MRTESAQQWRLQIIAGEKGERELCGARERERSVTPVFAIKTAGLREKEKEEGGFGKGKSQRLNERLEEGMELLRTKWGQWGPAT